MHFLNILNVVLDGCELILLGKEKLFRINGDPILLNNVVQTLALLSFWFFNWSCRSCSWTGTVVGNATNACSYNVHVMHGSRIFFPGYGVSEAFF